LSVHIAEEKTYWHAAIALAILLVLSLATAVIDFGGYALPVALAVAAIKVTVVATYFMHLRWSTPLTRLFAGAGLFWLVIILALTLFESASRTVVNT
jgi:cytochrome c oxidase subunit 4